VQIVSANWLELSAAESLRDLKRLTDPLLTALTITLAVILFVVAPLQAAGVVAVLATH